MLIRRIKNATRNLGKPLGWKDAIHGTCMHLPILDCVDGSGQAVMVSAWEPTPQELALLNKGATVYLQVMGIVHPPVAVFVDENFEIQAPSEHIKHSLEN